MKPDPSPGLKSPFYVGAVVYLDTTQGLHATTISRMTPTQCVTDAGPRFYRDTMRIVGERFRYARLPTEKVLARYKRECDERAADRARRMGFTPNAESDAR